MNFLIGLGLIAIGSLGLYYNRSVYNFTGRIDFVESKIPGGTVSFLKLAAVFVVFVGMLFATGLGSWLTQPLNDGFNSIFLRE